MASFEFVKRKKKKVVLVEPKAPDLHIFSFYPLPRLGTILLATIMRNRGFEAVVLAEEVAPIRMEDFDDACLVGISTTTSTANRAYGLADMLRERGIPVAMGGPHVTYLPDEALQHADYVVSGEGENIFPTLCEAVYEGETPPALPGLLAGNGRIGSSGGGTGGPCPPGKVPEGRKGDSLCAPQRQPLIADLDSLPIPDLNLVKGMKRFTDFSRRRVIPIQASRGCPYDCTFCSVTGMFGRQFRFKSVDRVMEEVTRYDDKHNHIFFYDDNLAANRKWLKTLLTEFARRKTRFTWSAQVRTEVARDPELLKLAAATNCTTFFIGIESVNPASLEKMDKKQSAEEIASAMAAFNRHRLPVHGMFVMGFDTDDERSIRATVRFAKQAGVNTAQFLVLTPFPGTRTYEELHAQGRILFDDWSLYDGHHVVFQPSQMDPLSLQNAHVAAHKSFYTPGRMLKKALKGRFEDAYIYGYAMNLNRNMRKRNRLYFNTLELMSQSDGVVSRVEYTHPARQVVGL